MATYSSICAYIIPWTKKKKKKKNPMDRGAWQATVHRSQRVRDDRSNLTHVYYTHFTDEKSEPHRGQCLVENQTINLMCLWNFSWSLWKN